MIIKNKNIQKKFRPEFTKNHCCWTTSKFKY